MNDDQIKTIEQVREFLTGTSSVKFSPCSKEGCYKWIEGILIRFGYRSRTKTEKGLLLDFMEKVSVRIPTHRDRSFQTIVTSHSDAS
uniref:Uncharacterized protein n=1 Tax=Candidatus Kentrum sp. SD TaxID=2126332 RepID=A0A451BRK9_9GAMM|nr:MAG: hypothetical protein BECKSD772D_GA0070982_11813 [Candidatus Kentron sp. SD]